MDLLAQSTALMESGFQLRYSKLFCSYLLTLVHDNKLQSYHGFYTMRKEIADRYALLTSVNACAFIYYIYFFAMAFILYPVNLAVRAILQ